MHARTVSPLRLLTVALLLNTNKVSKSFGATPLFRDVSFSIQEGDRLGLIGPNGSGKSTLLQILAGRIEPDSGDLVLRSGTRLVYVPQDSQFEPGETVRGVMRRALRSAGVPESEWQAREAETLGRAGFRDFDAEAATLSGGWRKRLSIAEALVQKPDIVLLDEPTNHLDLAGIEWLEKLLQGAPFACVIVSHDRYFLENVPTRMAELNRVYPDGLFYVAGNYSAFLEQKAEFLHAQAKRQSALENRVRTEMEWLRRGPKARATKAKARIDNAGELIAELSDLKSRSRTADAGIDFAATERKTKRLIHLEGLGFGFEGKHAVRRSRLHDHLRDARRAGRSEWQRQDHASAAPARRDRAAQRRSSARRRAADRLLRPAPPDQSGPDSAPGARAGQRFGDLSRPRDSRRVLGVAFPVYERATGPAGQTSYQAASGRAC